jgi:ElaB/YqjD/DUF883 family membrane-anchored ribosome-binding protein
LIRVKARNRRLPLVDLVDRNGANLMSKSVIQELRHDAEESLEDLAKGLHKAAEDLADDTEHAISAAAKALRDAAGAMAAKAPEPAKDLVRRASAEVRSHPISSTAAVLGAAAALIGLLASARKKTAT